MRVIILDKRAIQCCKGNVGQFVFLIEEFFYMIIYIFIHPECSYNTIRAYTRLKILVEGAEITHNYLLSRRHTSQKVFDIIASYSFVYF